MLSGMSATTFQEWQHYFAIEPFGESREELRHGQKMAQFANYHRDTDKKPEPFNALDFMNFTDRPEQPEPEPEGPEELSARIKREVFGM